MDGSGNFNNSPGGFDPRIIAWFNQQAQNDPNFFSNMSNFPNNVQNNSPSPAPYRPDFSQYSPHTFQSPINTRNTFGYSEGMSDSPIGVSENVPETQGVWENSSDDDNNIAPTTQKVPKQRWTKKEDQLLVSTYMNTSVDAIIGTNQKYERLWNRVFEQYCAAQMQRPSEIRPRTINMIRGRWDRMSTAVTRFAGAYDEAYRRLGNRSGYNEKDVVKEAVELYESSGKKFNDKHAWTLLKEYPKWEERLRNGKSRKGDKSQPPPPIHSVETDSESGASGKRIRTNDGGHSTPVTDEGGEGRSQEPPRRRPMGVKASKAARAGKGKQQASSDGGSSFEQSLSGFSDRLQIISERKKEAIELTRARIEQEERKINQRDREMKTRLLEKLLARNESDMSEMEIQMRNELWMDLRNN